MESILTSIKKVIGIEKEYNHFDPDIIMHANAAFASLTQMGIGPKEGFFIANTDADWNDYEEPGIIQNLVRQYVPLKVKMVFDPSGSSTVNDTIANTLLELEWRMHEQAEYENKEENDNA